MSFGWTAATWAAIGATAAVVGTASSIDASRKSANMAKDNAKRQQLAADEANNKANSKAPNSAALMAANMANGSMGQSGTMLTGPQGVDTGNLKLGKSSLLGGG